MKHLFTIFAALTSLVSVAQNLPNIAVGVIQSGAEQEFVTTPNSTIIVDMSMLESQFTAGVYARYAQKYLGERATLSDRRSIKITDSHIALAPEHYHIASESNCQEPTTTVKDPAQLLPIDRMSSQTIIPEQAAQDIASKIFANRKICRDLIAGDVGEGVFGAGLAAALERFDRMEREYISLFMGREQTTTSARRFAVSVVSSTKRYMLCRYDAQRGIVSANDLDGEPVYLQITPTFAKDSSIMMSIGKEPLKRSYIEPNQAKCDLYVGANIISSSVLPLYEFGRRITVTYDRK